MLKNSRVLASSRAGPTARRFLQAGAARTRARRSAGGRRARRTRWCASRRRRWARSATRRARRRPPTRPQAPLRQASPRPPAAWAPRATRRRAYPSRPLLRGRRSRSSAAAAASRPRHRRYRAGRELRIRSGSHACARAGAPLDGRAARRQRGWRARLRAPISCRSRSARDSSSALRRSPHREAPPTSRVGSIRRARGGARPPAASTRPAAARGCRRFRHPTRCTSARDGTVGQSPLRAPPDARPRRRVGRCHRSAAPRGYSSSSQQAASPPCRRRCIVPARVSRG
mmetsp:Transcript_31231/g.99886  ORF Transcript_31231/g.99886 Transcript_31231/m.99886 type:complete len:286 (-) Transcript_31231:189-1046(-)